MKNILIYFSATFFLFTCSKSNSRLVVGLPEPEQLFIVRSEKDTILRGVNGTQILFKANSFQDSLEQPVNGSVMIKLKEFYSVQDFINNRLSTQTIDGKVLRSSGMVSLKLVSDGGSVWVNPNKPYMIKLIPVIQYTEKIEAGGYGVEKVTRFIDTLGFISQTTGDSINFRRWPIGWDQPVDSLTIYENFLQGGYYLFEASNLGLINCDFFIDEELFYFTVELDNSISDVFVVLDSLNSVMYPDSVNTKANQYLFRIPEDKLITIVAYSQDEGKHLFAIQKNNSNLQRTSLKQIEWPLDKIKQEIKGLK